jgi:hypothetical protein
VTQPWPLGALFASAGVRPGESSSQVTAWYHLLSRAAKNTNGIKAIVNMQSKNASSGEMLE